MASFLEYPVFGNPPVAWLVAALIVIGTTAVAAGLRSYLLRWFEPLTNGVSLHWRGALYELARRALLPVAFVLGLYAGSRILKLPPTLDRSLAALLVIAVFIQGALWADQLLASVTEWQLAGRRAGAAAARNALAIIRFLSRVTVWAVALLLIFSNLGFDVTALVAGLGIGGVAIALAAQSVLADLFASIAIVLDRPFGVGDFIEFGDERGTVERIGIKTTRIRSLSGEQIACANTGLLASRIHNFRLMSERRVIFNIGIAYETPFDQVAQVPALLREIINTQDAARFERAHFRAYGQHSLAFEVAYRVIGCDYTAYMDVQQAINLAMLRRFEAEGIAFGHPDRAPSLKSARHTEPLSPRALESPRSPDHQARQSAKTDA